MFGRKKEDEGDGMAENMERNDSGTSASAGRKESGDTPRMAPGRPEIVRRAPDIHADAQRMGGRNGDGKKLVVGRDIALNGEIKSCDKLVVEGHVEADMRDCHEIEITETGSFKGAAEIEFADISGSFEGTLIARELLIVRGTGRITGSVRFGQLEIERGGEIIGDVQTFAPENGRSAAPSLAAEIPAE